jgi:hypothetical protein
MAARVPTPKPATVVLIVAALWWLMRHAGANGATPNGNQANPQKAQPGAGARV